MKKTISNRAVKKLFSHHPVKSMLILSFVVSVVVSCKTMELTAIYTPPNSREAVIKAPYLNITHVDGNRVGFVIARMFGAGWPHEITVTPGKHKIKVTYKRVGSFGGVPGGNMYVEYYDSREIEIDAVSGYVYTINYDISRNNFDHRYIKYYVTVNQHQSRNNRE